MKIFLLVLTVSIAASIELWNFGIAARIWPAHPLIATTLLATAVAMIIQIVLSSDARRAKRGTKL